MPIKSKWTVDVPQCSLPTFLFGPSSNASQPVSKADKLAFAEAPRPDTHCLTRNQFKVWSQRFAHGLRSSGLFKEGDRILFFSANDLFAPVVFMGTLCAGGIFTGANPTFTPRELAHQLSDSGASVLICSDASIDTGIEAAKQANLDPSRVFVFNGQIYDGKGSASKGCRYWGDLVSPDSPEVRSFAWPDYFEAGENNATLALNYSSGTTGVPKGVEITHLNYISNTVQVEHMSSLLPDYEERSERARWLCFLPLYHAYGQTFYIAGAFNRQIPVYVMQKFDFLEMLKYTEKFKITDFTLVPPIAIALSKHPDVHKYDLSSVENLGSGAAPLGRDTGEIVEKRLKNKANMKQGWGMTE